MAEGVKSGLLDLEKELSCSICTEVFYQPLTLLDCLHTFCGSCLKEWFSWQASQATHAKPNPYTCPSCRASVRETRPDAKVTTLLEMFLQANPNRGKTEEEKAEMRQKYKVGDEVMPKIELKRESSADAEDRRMVQEIREISLREVGVRGAGTYERGARHRYRDNSRDTTEDEVRHRRREQERRRRHGAQGSTAEQRERPTRVTESRSQARHIEHQSSLRSLISDSDVDSAEMEAEILRQIMDEGLLDGIDLNNLDVSQEDELSERIADAYRRRHGQTLRSGERRTDESSESSTREGERERPRHREQQRPAPAQQPTHPPISRPHLFEAYPTGNGHRRRTSSEHRRQTSPATSTPRARASADTQRQAARSDTDLSDRPRTTTNVRARPRGNARRTDSPDQDSADSSRRAASHARQTSTSSATDIRAQVSSSQAGERSEELSLPQTASTSMGGNSRASVCPQRTDHERQAPYPLQDLNSPALGPSSAAATSRPTLKLYLEPMIHCNRCEKSNIAYELHHNCSVCENGNYNICNQCYRLGKGCLHWYGFGKAAMHRYERQTPPGGYPPNHPLPHAFRAHRFLQPPIEARLSSGSRHISSDPAKRLQSGFFCSNCSAFANECFWKCGRCNEGEWGFCNACVNQGKCCTHPLLPVAHTSAVPRNDRPMISNPHSSFIPVSEASRSISQSDFVRLSFRTACDICTYPISPSTTRFHCPQCNKGDYDICTSCYLKLVSTNRISNENSDKGWRKCPQGHRMIIVGFEDGPLGQRRIVVRDLVGGYALKDDETGASGRKEEWRWRDEGTLKTVPATSPQNTPSHSPSLGTWSSSSHPSFPPSGGTGLTAVALWAYWPRDGADDELGFPKNAEIREAVDINGDWFWGVYCGRGGLWPGGYARVVR